MSDTTTTDKARDVYISACAVSTPLKTKPLNSWNARLDAWRTTRRWPPACASTSTKPPAGLASRGSPFAARHQPFTMKDTMMSLVGNMAALGHSAAPDEVLKNTFANFAFEDFEIASYTSLLILADLAGHRAGRSALETSPRRAANGELDRRSYRSNGAALRKAVRRRPDRRSVGPGMTTKTRPPM